MSFNPPLPPAEVSLSKPLKLGLIKVPEASQRLLLWLLGPSFLHTNT